MPLPRTCELVRPPVNTVQASRSSTGRPHDGRGSDRDQATADFGIGSRLTERPWLSWRPMAASAVCALGFVGAQSRNVLGAYFPSWMFCVLIALAVTAAIRWLFGKVGVERSLPAPIVVYLALTVVFSLGGWLLWLS